MTRQNRVTVVIPTFRRPMLAVAAAESALRAATRETELRVVVVDNASPESPEPLLRRRFGARVEFLSHTENIGLVGNWNRCRELAQASDCDYWLMLEDDNLLEAGYFGEALAAMRTHPECDWFHSAVTEFDNSGWERTWRPWSLRPGGPPAGTVGREELIGWPFLTQIRVSSLLVRQTDRLRGLPLYFAKYRYQTDQTALCEFALRAKGCYSDQPLMRYFVNPVSATAQALSAPRFVVGEALRACNCNVQAVVADGRFDLQIWRAAAERAPVDRLLLAALSLHGRQRGELLEVRDVLTEVLHSRRAELTGRVGRVARLAGFAAWPVARVAAGVLSRLKRPEERKA